MCVHVCQSLLSLIAKPYIKETTQAKNMLVGIIWDLTAIVVYLRGIGTDGRCVIGST